MGPRPTFDDAPTGELIKQALEDARNLVRIEVRMAKEEAKGQLESVKRAAIAGAIAAVAAILFLSMASVALILALGGGAGVALIAAAFYLLIACVAGGLAYRFVPRKPVGETRKRIEDEIKELKEHVA